MNEMQCTENPFKCTVGPDVWNADAPAAWSFTAPTTTDLMVQLRHGDISAWDKANGHNVERAEVSGSDFPLPQNTDFWLEFDLIIEPGPPVTSQWCVLGQLHPTATPAQASFSPAWSQEFDAGDIFRIVIRSAVNVPQVLFEDPKMVRGQKYHFMYHFRYGQNGTLTCWRDGVKIVRYSGVLGYLGEPIGPYFKFGIYRNPSPETLIVSYQNLEIGPTPD